LERPKRTIFENLLKSAELTGVNLVDCYELENYSQIVDSIFGFSFNPEGNIYYIVYIYISYIYYKL